MAFTRGMHFFYFLNNDWYNGSVKWLLCMYGIYKVYTYGCFFLFFSNNGDECLDWSVRYELKCNVVVTRSVIDWH